MDRTIERRLAVHAALADRTRLSIVDDLAVSDRSPTELSRRHGIPGNLLAHHLDALESAGLIDRFASSGDGRRRYIRLRHAELAGFGLTTPRPSEPVVFVCTRNSARSQLAAALWRARSGGEATSAGTHPADEVHPGALAAAARAGLDLDGARPRHLAEAEGALVVTVCDRAHEALGADPSRWHWSTVDPAASGTDAAFDTALADLDHRMRALLEAPS